MRRRDEIAQAHELLDSADLGCNDNAPLVDRIAELMDMLAGSHEAQADLHDQLEKARFAASTNEAQAKRINELKRDNETLRAAIVEPCCQRGERDAVTIAELTKERDKLRAIVTDCETMARATLKHTGAKP